MTTVWSALRGPFATRPELRQYEAAILAAWRSSLSPENQRLLDAQLAQVDTVDRGLGDRIVACYSRRYPPAETWPEELLFMDRGEDLKAATVRGRFGDGPIVRAVVYTHRGRFFNLRFDRSLDGVPNEARAPLRPGERIDDRDFGFAVIGVEAH